MKLDTNVNLNFNKKLIILYNYFFFKYLQYISKDELRVLVAVEMGMKNHEVK